MTDNLHTRAKELAARPYLVQILRDDSDPTETLYVALNPELEGCMAQGMSVDEAESALDEFRVEYIEHLLEHNLPVPNPATMPPTITGILQPDAIVKVRLERQANQDEVREIKDEPEYHESSEAITVSVP